MATMSSLTPPCGRKNTYRGPANCGPANKGDSLPLEMIIPVVTPWMKDLCQGIRFKIDPRQVSSFVKVTIDACKREVIKLNGAAMYLPNDVLYEERPAVSLPDAVGNPSASMCE